MENHPGIFLSIQMPNIVKYYDDYKIGYMIRINRRKPFYYEGGNENVKFLYAADIVIHTRFCNNS